MASNNGGAMSDMEDDYDVISNPGHDGELTADEVIQGRDVSSCREIPALADAQDRFETARWQSLDIEAYVKKQLETAESYDRRRVRVYVDGTFDGFGVGHALQLRQAKLAFPFVHLVVGVFSDDTLLRNSSPPVYPEVERLELLRHCRWVDEVLRDAPWDLSIEFTRQRAIDFVAIDEGTSVDPTCDKARLRGYDVLKKHGKIIKTKRTVGLAPQQRPSAFQLPSESQRATPTIPHRSPQATKPSELALNPDTNAA